jgi:hypothetical protein
MHTLFGNMEDSGRSEKPAPQEVIIVESTGGNIHLQVFLPLRTTTISKSGTTYWNVKVVDCLGLKKGTTPRPTLVELWFDDNAACHVFTFRDKELSNLPLHIYMKEMDASNLYMGRGYTRHPLASHSWTALRAFISSWVGEVKHQQPGWAK